jgi:hypothetical protein
MSTFYAKYPSVGSGGGGGGIQSINGDTTSAQVIAAGAGISVVSAGGTTTITNTGGGVTASTTWLTADGTTKVFAHNLASNNVEVALVDLSDNSVIGIDSIVLTNNNTVTLTASEAPASSWRVIVQS